MPTMCGTIAPNGARIIIGRPGIRDPAVTRLDDMARTFFSIIDVVLDDDEDLSVTGVNMIIDAQGLSFAHVAQMTPPIIKQMSTIIQVMTFLCYSVFTRLRRRQNLEYHIDAEALIIFL